MLAECACWPRKIGHPSCCGKFALKVTRRFIVHTLFPKDSTEKCYVLGMDVGGNKE